MTQTTPPSDPGNLDAFTDPSISLPFGGQPLTITELSVRQVIALSQHTTAIAALDFSDLPALLSQHSGVVVTLLSIALAVPTDRVLGASASQLTAALAAVVSLNKAFFLAAVQTVVQAAVLKSTIQQQSQAQLQAQIPLAAQRSGQTASQPLSTPATASATSSATPGPATSPTAAPQTVTPKPEPASSSSSPE